MSSKAADIDDNEDEIEDANAVTEFSSDVYIEEEAVEEQDAGPLDSWESFHEHIDDLMCNERCPKVVRELDSRSYKIQTRARQQIRDAPKSIADRCKTKKSQVEQQLVLTDTRLGELTRFGNELVTNIRVANERREVDRRRIETEKRAKLEELMHYETVESIAKFNDIKARWTELERFNEPMTLWDHMDKQKKRMAEIMERKEQMIEACQKEIKRMNAKYELDRERQSADLACLVERVDNQIESLKAAYTQHLVMLRNTIEDERQIFTVSAAEKWRSFFNALNNNFDEKREFVKNREKFYAMQTMKVNDEQEELTKMTRIRLDKECERLELELRRTRDNVLMNSEKLDYNYQVLQKRNEENVIINNQQKRRVARLHEIAMNTRQRLKKLYQTGQTTIQRLSSEIEKLHANISVMERKSQQARVKNKEKFDRVWEINYKELTDLVNRVYEIDRVLYQQLLVMPWQRPSNNIDDINRMTRHRNDVLTRIDLRAGKLPKFQKVVGPKEGELDLEELSPQTVRMMRNVMRKLSDRCGFLIEEQLLKLLEPYSKVDKCLVRVENIFSALRMHRLRDIEELAHLFSPFTYCPTCQTAGLNPAKCAEAFMQNNRQNRFLKMMNRAQENEGPSVVVDPYAKLGGLNNTCPNHLMVMEPALILHCLNVYTSNLHKRIYANSTITSNAINLIRFSDETIRTFWRKFPACFPESKSKLWRTLEHGLNHYVEVLKMREQYDIEVEFLRRQNTELRHLLQKFLV